MSCWSSDTVIPYPFQSLCCILRTWKFIGYHVVCRKTKAGRLTAFIDDRARNIELKRVVWSIKDVHAHVTEGSTAVIHYLSPVAWMIITFFIRSLRSSSLP